MVVCDNYNVSWVNGDDKLVVEAAHVKVIRKNFRFVVRPMVQCIFRKIVLDIMRRHFVLCGSREHDFGLSRCVSVVIFSLQEQ